MLIFLTTFFYFYNFGLYRYEQYYIGEKDRLQKLGLGLSKECRYIDKHRNSLSLRLITYEVLSQFKCFDKWLKTTSDTDDEPVSIFHLKTQI